VSHFLAVRWTTFAVSPPLPCAFSSLPGVLYLDARHRGFAQLKKNGDGADVLDRPRPAGEGT
jgi:hypothetical protein